MNVRHQTFFTLFDGVAAACRVLLTISVLAVASDVRASLDLDPAVIGSSNPYPPRGRLTAVAVQNGLAYCALGSSALTIFDVRDPTKPFLLSARQAGAVADYGGWGNSVALFGSYVCFGHGSYLSIFDVKDPADPRLL